MAAETAQAAFLVAHADFDGTELLATVPKVVEKSEERGAFLRRSLISKDKETEFGGVVAQDFLNLGADESVVLVGIDNEDEVGEAVHKAASKFLLLMEALFDGAALGDVDKGALIAHDVAVAVAYGGSGVEAGEGLAVLATQGEFDAFGNGLAMYFANDGGALKLVDKDLGNALAEEFVARVVAEHAHEGGIDLDDFVVGGDDVDAFLKSFE